MGLASALILGSCGGEPDGGAPSADRAPPPGVPGEEAVAVAPSARASRFLGVLTLEGGAEFILCEGTPLPLDGPAFLDMVGLHSELAPGLEPMEGIFADVLGEVRESQEGPWLRALELRRAALEGWGCGRDEVDILLEASGTEPFWTLTVQDSLAIWRMPEGSKQFVHGGPALMPRGGWEVVVDAVDARVELRAEFYQEPCRDSMSGAWSHLSAEVVLEGREYRGCAFIGPGWEGRI